MRVSAATAVKRLGFTPVPHISSRRLKSQEMLEEYLEALRDVGAAENVLVIGGDPTVAMGPYEESLAVIESGVLQQYGVRHISTGGHPSGDPNIPGDVLWSAMQKKAAALSRLEIPGTIITQVDFDVDRVLQWIGEVRDTASSCRSGSASRPGQRQAAARLRLPARPVHLHHDREEVRPVGHQPARQGGPRPVHPRPAGGPRPGQARRGEAALLHLRRLQDDGGVDRELPAGVLTAALHVWLVPKVIRSLPPGRSSRSARPSSLVRGLSLGHRESEGITARAWQAMAARAGRRGTEDDDDREQRTGRRRIVVGVDGSDSSKAALAWAVRQAALTGAKVDAVHAWHEPVSYGYGYGYAMIVPVPDLEKFARQALDKAIAAVTDLAPASTSGRWSWRTTQRRRCLTPPRAPTCSWSAAGGTPGSPRRCSARLASTACTTRTARSSSSAAPGPRPPDRGGRAPAVR